MISIEIVQPFNRRLTTISGFTDESKDLFQKIQYYTQEAKVGEISLIHMGILKKAY
jgi:hypothetical protein